MIVGFFQGFILYTQFSVATDAFGILTGDKDTDICEMLWDILYCLYKKIALK